MTEIKLPEPEIFVIEHFGYGYRETHIGFTADQMKAAILEERERCAKLCESKRFNLMGIFYEGYDQAIEECADAIRSQ